MNKHAVVFLGQAYPAGVYFNLARLGVAMYNVRNTGIDFFYAASHEEANAGAWQYIRETIPEDRILSSDHFESVIDVACELFAKYDRIVFHTGGGWGQIKHLIPLKKRFKSRMYITAITHSFRIWSWMRAPMSLFQTFLYGCYVDKVIFQCPYAMQKFFGAKCLLKMGKVGIIPLGCELVDVEKGEVPKVVESLQIEECFSERTFTFVYLAQLHKGKRHKMLIDAVSPVFERHGNARLLLCGQGPMREYLQDIVKRSGLEGRVVFTGQIPRKDIPWVLQHAQCAIVPTRAETFGHAFVEPMMAGIPVIGTRVGVGEYLIQDYRTGIGVAVDDIEGIRKATEFMLQNPTECESMGYNAKKIASQLFCYDSIAEAHMSLCKSLLGHSFAKVGAR